MSRDKKGWGLDATRPRRSPNAKETVHEGTYNMQRESLMLSRLRLYWEVILENHFPSPAGGVFGVSTSKPCALHFPCPSPFLPRHPPPHSSQAMFILLLKKLVRWGFTGGARESS